MGVLLALIGFLMIIAGIIVFIIASITKKSLRIGVIIAIVGFFLINLSSFPLGPLYGLTGFLMFIVGLIMLAIAGFKGKSIKTSLIIVVAGLFAFLIGLTNPTNFYSTETESTTVVDSDEVLEVEDMEGIIEEPMEEPLEEKEPAEEKDVEEIIEIGNTLIVDDVYYVVNKISTSQNVGGEYGKEAQSQFTIINLTVQNEQNEAIKVNSDQFTLLSGERTYESDAGAAIYANDDHDFFYTEINPGVSMTGNIVFDIPVGLENLKLSVQTDLWGTETGIVHLQ